MVGNRGTDGASSSRLYDVFPFNKYEVSAPHTWDVSVLGAAIVTPSPNVQGEHGLCRPEVLEICNTGEELDSHYSHISYGGCKFDLYMRLNTVQQVSIQIYCPSPGHFLLDLDES